MNKGSLQIPWPMKPLSDIASVDWGNTSITKESYTPKGFLAYSAAGPDGFVEMAEHSRTGVVVSAIGARCGRSFLAEGDWTAIKNTIVVLPDENILLSSFLFQLAEAKNIWPIDGGAQPFIGIGKAKKILIPLPPIPEQHKISQILATSDTAISEFAALIGAKQQQKKALMQQLLTGKRRLKCFDSTWQEVTLDDLCTRLTAVADDPNGYPVLSITAGTGFVSQEDKFSRIIAGKQVENYVLLKRGEFAYNKGNSYRFPQGCVYQLNEYEEGLVPNVFYSFRLNEQKAAPEFIKQYFLAGLHNKDLYRWINSGVRNNGLLNLNASDFFKLPIKLPQLEEQHAIGDVLRTADEEIKSLNDKLTVLQEQKKALMQKLLTGQVRVKF